MAVDLPDLTRAAFVHELEGEPRGSISSEATEALWGHYQELRRWSRRLSLVGPGTASEVVQRHYVESLAALPWCPGGARVHVDVGSGGGFPGLVLAAANPGWSSYLVEPRVRKWAFLQAAARRSGLSCRCLNARVDDQLPDGFPDRFDVLSLRALKLSTNSWDLLCSRLADGGRVLWWQGEETAEIPGCLKVIDSRRIAGSRSRRLVWAEPDV